MPPDLVMWMQRLSALMLIALISSLMRVSLVPIFDRLLRQELAQLTSASASVLMTSTVPNEPSTRTH